MQELYPRLAEIKRELYSIVGAPRSMHLVDGVTTDSETEAALIARLAELNAEQQTIRAEARPEAMRLIGIDTDPRT